MIYNGGVSLFILLTFLGPLYLAIERGGQYNWIGLTGMFFEALIGFMVSLILYRCVINRKLNISTKDTVILGIFIIIQIILTPIFNYLATIVYFPQSDASFSFDSVFNIFNILPLGCLIILITHPGLIKKYFLKK